MTKALLKNSFGCNNEPLRDHLVSKQVVTNKQMCKYMHTFIYRYVHTVKEDRTNSPARTTELEPGTHTLHLYRRRWHKTQRQQHLIQAYLCICVFVYEWQKMSKNTLQGCVQFCDMQIIFQQFPTFATTNLWKFWQILKWLHAAASNWFDEGKFCKVIAWHYCSFPVKMRLMRI